MTDIANLDDLTVSGQCPVQGYAAVNGHLFYFRARGEWTLQSWPPGDWADSGDPDKDVTAALDRYEYGAYLRLDETNETNEGFPAWPHDVDYRPEGSIFRRTEDYPGWWSHEYALMVFKWAVSRVLGEVTQ
jgi:hypothetical protein